MKLQIKRIVSRIFFFFSANLGFKLGFFNGKTGFCYPFFYCNSCPTATSACPIRAIEVGIFEKNIKWKILMLPILTIGFVGTLTGRAVCGWACPIGFLQRGTAKVARKIKPYINLFKGEEASKIEAYMRYIKYLVFIVTILVTAYFIGFMFTDICPVGFLVGTIPINILYPGQYFPNEFFYPALVIFILFIILIFLIERGWCKYFCPVGAMFAPFNKISILHVSVDKEKCTHCNICSEVCPMGIDVPNMNRDPECILCGKCVSACPQNLIKFKKGV